jgi:tripartite ATP-independent transporter DctP family solute receptor
MVQSGAIEMSFESPIILALFLKDKRFDAFSMPWLFPDIQTARRACTGELGDIACEWLTKHNLVGIGVGVNGFRQLTNSKRAVRGPDDLKGVKVRVAGSDLFLNTFKLLGANAVTMNFGEVFTSLQEGVIDGQENPLAIIYTSKLYEVQKHLTLWNYAFDPIILCANEGVWKSLSPDDQETFRACAREAMDYQWDYSEKLEAEILADLAAKGVTITKLSAAELAVFRDAAQPIYEQLDKSLGADTVAKWREVVEKASAEE